MWKLFLQFVKISQTYRYLSLLNHWYISNFVIIYPWIFLFCIIIIGIYISIIIPSRKIQSQHLLLELGTAAWMRLTDFVRQVLLPNTKFLQDGWHIYLDTVGTLSEVCLEYLKDVMGDNENNFQYWNNSLVSRLNYKFITAKSESGQRMKAVFEGEFIFLKWFVNSNYVRMKMADPCLSYLHNAHIIQKGMIILHKLFFKPNLVISNTFKSDFWHCHRVFTNMNKQVWLTMIDYY